MKTKVIIAGTLAAMCVGLFNVPACTRLPGDPACVPDAVKAGSVCMDKYEASVWQIPASNARLIEKVQKGAATLADLTAGNATQISPSATDTPAFPATFPANGQWTAPLYAVSIPGVHPTAYVTWFQAQQACANSRKRLPSNAEWQMAVAGTPDPGGDNGTTDCNTASVLDAVNTGSRTACVSNYGAFDMVGNVDEWVADWVQYSTANPGWGSFSNDFMALSGASTTVTAPAALVRGGWFDETRSGAGPLYVVPLAPQDPASGLGFRCAR